jgi:hypothetical protein
MYGIIEVAPNVFSVLSTWESNTFGPSVFTITSAGTVKPIYSLPPYTLTSNMVQDTNGRLYVPALLNPTGGAAYESIDLAGAAQQYPFPGLWNSGSESGKFTFLHEFTAAEGVPNGNANMVLGADGNFYSLANQPQQGSNPIFIFRVTPGGAYSRLLTFPAFPGHAQLPLVAASDGNLYGSFSAGGTNNTGEIYQAALSGQLQFVANFPATGMSDPWTLMQAADGNLYGTTNYNQIFRYDLTTHELIMVYQLDPGGAQGKCACILIEGMDGILYGLAPYGGTYPGYGTVFSLDIGLPKPNPTVSGLYPASGPVGKVVALWGNYLLSATSVTFNGTPAAKVAVTSIQSVHATVPAGATSGPVTVTTANGTFTTTANFTVQ